MRDQDIRFKPHGGTRPHGGHDQIRAALYMPAAMRRLLLLIYTLWKNGEEYDETRDKTHTPRKMEPELEYGPDDCIGRIDDEPVDWNAVDGNGEPPF